MSKENIDNNLPKICGYICEIVPILQTEFVTDEEAKAAAHNLFLANAYLTNHVSDSYNILHDRLKEIQIVQSLEDDKRYDCSFIDDKAVLKIKSNVSYTEACHFLFSMELKVNMPMEIDLLEQMIGAA